MSPFLTLPQAFQPCGLASHPPPPKAPRALGSLGPIRLDPRLGAGVVGAARASGDSVGTPGCYGWAWLFGGWGGGTHNCRSFQGCGITRGVSNLFCDTFGNLPPFRGLVFGSLFLLHRSGFHFGSELPGVRLLFLFPRPCVGRRAASGCGGGCKRRGNWVKPRGNTKPILYLLEKLYTHNIYI